MIMDIAKKIQILMSLTTLIVLRSLVGLENRVQCVCEWNLRSGESNDKRIVFVGPS